MSIYFLTIFCVILMPNYLNGEKSNSCLENGACLQREKSSSIKIIQINELTYYHYLETANRNVVIFKLGARYPKGWASELWWISMEPSFNFNVGNWNMLMPLGLIIYYLYWSIINNYGQNQKGLNPCLKCMRAISNQTKGI